MASFRISYLTSALLFSVIGTSIGFQSLHTIDTSPRPFTSLTHLSAYKSNYQDQQSRRQFHQSISSILATTSIITSSSSAYALEKLQTFIDYDYGFRISTPSAWKQTTQTLSGRRKAIFFTPTDNENSNAINTLMYIAYTPIRDDFTSLSSFGSVDAVALATILPKGELGGSTDKDSKMISAISKKNAYYFDYVSTPVIPVEAGMGEGGMLKELKKKHFRTIFTLMNNANTNGDGAVTTTVAGSTLVTITVQTEEDEYGNWRGLFDEIVDSFDRI